MKKIILSIILLYSLVMSFPLRAQDYYQLYISNPYCQQNEFIKQKPDLSSPPTFQQSKHLLPSPYWQSHDEAISAYWKAWEIAFSDLKSINTASGFVSPYIDAAFNGCIFMWDTTFMTLFGKYGARAFDFQGSLNNFYAKQQPDGFICREIRSVDGNNCFERFDPSSTGPNIMAWSEWEYFKNFNDTIRLRKVFPPLLAYYKWLQLNRTWKDGTYFTSGWGSGMDNQPRLPAGYDIQWSNGHMSWIDTNLQQIFSSKILQQMAEMLHRTADVAWLKKETSDLTSFVNSNMWNDSIHFYTDLFDNGTLSSVMSIGSYWSLLAGIVPSSRLTPYLSHLSNKDEFCRLHRIPSLSASTPGYEADGGYWKGGVWAPAVYMVLRGLTNVGQDSLAYEIACNHLHNVVEVYHKTGTFFENYAPDRVQGNDRKDFVGWTGLPPIAELLEYIFGIRADVPHNHVIWDIRLTDAFGVNDYPFGKDGTISFHCAKRKSVNQRPEINVTSNVPFTLTLIWKGGKQDIRILPNKQQAYNTIKTKTGKWQLVWNDEFDYNGLPDSKRWSYDTEGNTYGWGNNESQCYTESNASNAWVSNGILSITARKEKEGNKNYTSARLITKDKGDWLYGRFEIRAKLPTGRGTWPAIWMLPTDWEYGTWPASGEIDIMENVGCNPDSIVGTVHTQKYNHLIGTQKSARLYCPDSYRKFHTYALEWTPQECRLYVDGIHYFTYHNPHNGSQAWPFDKRFHLLLNLAIGGNWGGMKGIDDNIFPQQLQIDYVRVYQKIK